LAPRCHPRFCRRISNPETRKLRNSIVDDDDEVGRWFGSAEISAVVFVACKSYFRKFGHGLTVASGFAVAIANRRRYLPGVPENKKQRPERNIRASSKEKLHSIAEEYSKGLGTVKYRVNYNETCSKFESRMGRIDYAAFNKMLSTGEAEAAVRNYVNGIERRVRFGVRSCNQTNGLIQARHGTAA
jgi:hypothetical protein